MSLKGMAGGLGTSLVAQEEAASGKPLRQGERERKKKKKAWEMAVGPDRWLPQASFTHLESLCWTCFYLIHPQIISCWLVANLCPPLL